MAHKYTPCWQDETAPSNCDYYGNICELEEMYLAMAATSMWQREWGLWAFQALIPQVKDCIEVKLIGRQKTVMKVMNLLFNLHATEGLK